MKTSLIVIGSFLLFSSVIVLIVPIPNSQYSILQVYNLCNSTLGTIGQAFSGEAQENCLMITNLLVPIFSVGFIGFILLLVGLIKK